MLYFFHRNNILYFQLFFLGSCMYFNNPLKNKVNGQSELGIFAFILKFYGNVLEGEIM